MMNDRAGDRLAERGPDSNRRRNRAQSQVETTRAARQVGNHQHGNHAKDARANPVEHLDADEQQGAAGHDVENSAYGQDSESDQQEWFSSPGSRKPPQQSRDQRDRKLSGYNARRHEHHRSAALTSGKHFTEQRQHGRIGKMEKHCATEEYRQRTILEQISDADGLAVILAISDPARQLVVDLIRTDEQQHKHRWGRQNAYQKEDRAVGDEISDQSHAHRGGYVSR